VTLRFIKFLLILLIAASFTARADAKTWAVDYTKSKLGFTGMQGGNAFEGSFKNFKTDIDFDPDHPELGTITATIDIASASTGDGEKDGMLPQSDWFDTSKFPQAQFASTQIRKTGTNSYEALGNLMIKGISKSIPLSFTLQQEGDHWRAQGKTTLTRTDFHIGAGQWSSDETVKLGVDVTIDIAAKPQA
jgi:polyisoprenoid-binding protein YceI